MEDSIPFWQRACSGEFIKTLVADGICLEVLYTTTIKNKTGGMEIMKHSAKLGIELTKLSVIPDYPLKMEAEEVRSLEVGDILRVNVVRDYYGVPSANDNHPPWRCTHDALLG